MIVEPLVVASHSAPCPSDRSCLRQRKFKAAARQTFPLILSLDMMSSYLPNHPGISQRQRLQNDRLGYGIVTLRASSSRQGADQGSCCPACYMPQQPGNKFCVSCGAPQLVSGGIKMLWSFDEARAKQYTNAENGASSCGPCSILSALSMIGKHSNAHHEGLIRQFLRRPGRSCTEANS
jgi:hypothetical protein